MTQLFMDGPLEPEYGIWLCSRIASGECGPSFDRIYQDGNACDDLCRDCQQGRCRQRQLLLRTLAMALVGLKRLLPNLPGLIREHVALFGNNPRGRLSFCCPGNL